MCNFLRESITPSLQLKKGIRSHWIPNPITLLFVISDRSTGVPGSPASIRLIMERFAWDGLHDGMDTMLHSIPIVQSAPPPSLFKLCDFLGFERIRTTAYHPAANGMIKHLHRQLKAALMSHAARKHWVENLPIVILGIQSTFKPEWIEFFSRGLQIWPTCAFCAPV